MHRLRALGLSWSKLCPLGRKRGCLCLIHAKPLTAGQAQRGNHPLFLTGTISRKALSGLMEALQPGFKLKENRLQKRSSLVFPYFYTVGLPPQLSRNSPGLNDPSGCCHRPVPVARVCRPCQGHGDHAVLPTVHLTSYSPSS